MKIIFLDVDGVLNYVMCKAKSPCGAIGVEDSCIEILAKIVDESGACIVLVSSWKHGWNDDIEKRKANPFIEDLTYLVDALYKHGIHIIDRTYDGNGDRGYGISEWLRLHPDITEWAVIDDDMFPDYIQYNIIPRLVQTSFYTGGLKEEHIEQCLHILNTMEEDHGS